MIHQCYFYFSNFQLSYLMIERMRVIYPERNNRKKESLLKTKDNFFLFFISWFSYLKTDRKQLTLKETTESWNLNNCKRSFLCMTTSPTTTTNRIGILFYFILFSFLFFLHDFCSLFKIRIWIGGFFFLFLLNLFLEIKFYSFF